MIGAIVHGFHGHAEKAGGGQLQSPHYSNSVGNAYTRSRFPFHLGIKYLIGVPKYKYFDPLQCAT